ncbi:Uncharacterized protein OBRU01_09099, partial [Operophtera brumata]
MLNINLGAGESELFSPQGSLNDTQWHHVSVTRREANLTMKIDDSAVKKRLGGRFFELNIHFGIFLGGQGHFSELFLGHMENFRGCMEDVYYNGVKIIEKARSRSGSVRVEGVTWNCAPEFDADVNSDISFVDENGAVKVKMARGQIVHSTRVNDGQWHKMHLLFNPSLIEHFL